MPFAEFVAENFESIAGLTWDLKDGRVSAHFYVDEARVEVRFEQRAPGEWTLSFETATPKGGEDYHRAFFVFNGVFQAAEEFIAVRQPDRLVFTTKREQLAHIYATYLGRERARIEAIGYRLLDTRKVEPFTEYILERNRDSNWKE